MASRSIQPFLHSSPQSVPILYNGQPLPRLEIASFHRASRRQSNAWFFGYPESSNHTTSRSVDLFLSLTERLTNGNCSNVSYSFRGSSLHIPSKMQTSGNNRTQWTVKGSVSGAVSLRFFVCVWNISGTTERICARFTRKTCLVTHFGKFESQGQRSRSPGTKTALFGPFGSLHAVPLAKHL